MYDGGIPQGACTSPVISNIASFSMDIRLNAYANKNNYTYSRYVDDITLSAEDYSLNNNTFFINKVVQDCGYQINDKKTRFQNEKGHQEVTGIVVNNNKLSVNKYYFNKVRQELYYIKKYGLDDHMKKSNIYNKFYQEYLKGKILFINMIDKDKGKKLFSKYNEIDWNN